MYIKQTFITLSLCSLVLSLPQTIFAQTHNISTSSSSVRAEVPGKSLEVSGIVAPFASVILLSSTGQVYRGTVADGNGNFFIPNVLVPTGLDEFCLETVDAKRLGNSLACFPLVLDQEKIIINDIFLPPTIGLQRDEVVEGTDAVVFGYSMPSAQVEIEMNSGQSFIVTADPSGEYEYTIPDIKMGSYQLVAGASYEAKLSSPSIRPAILQAVAAASSLGVEPLSVLWPLVVLVLIALIYIFRQRIRALFAKKPKKLHHWWFVGY